MDTILFGSGDLERVRVFVHPLTMLGLDRFDRCNVRVLDRLIYLFAAFVSPVKIARYRPRSR